MTANNDCPSDEDLRRLLSESVVSERSSVGTHHIGGCQVCQQRLGELTSVAKVDATLPMLNQNKTTSPQLDVAIDRAKLLFHSTLAGNTPNTTEFHPDSPNHVPAFTEDGYGLLGMIGRGGMGVVYAAREKSLDRPVAVKVLASQLAGDATARQRFLREAQSAAAVVHPNVITIHAVSDRPPLPYIVMELVTGVSLQQQLDSGSGISVENLVRIGRQSAAGLAAAHEKGVVHRDIKPANILLNSQTGRVLVGDFGLARAADHQHLTQTGMLVGTPAYVAPELLNSPAEADQRSDLFSLGVVLYAMCTGDSPFQADSLLATLNRVSACKAEPLTQAAPHVPEWLSDIVMRLLKPHPDDRFQSAGELRQALRDQSTTIAPKTPVEATALSVERTSAHVMVEPKEHSELRTSQRRQRRLKKRKIQNNVIFAGLLGTALLIGCLAFVLSRPTGSLSSDTAPTSSKTGPPSSASKPIQLQQTTDLRIKRVGPEKGLSNSRTPKPVINGRENESQRFIWSDNQSNRRSSFPSLSEAIAGFDGEGQIEIHHDGFLEVEGCLIDESGARIVAGDGYAPVLVLKRDREQELEALFQVAGELTLRGLELRLPKSIADDEAALISVEPEGELRLTDCVLVVEEPGRCIWSQSNVTMDHCQLHAAESVVVHLDSTQDSRVQLRQCWVSGETAFEAECDRDCVLTLDRCTIACENSVSISVDGHRDGSIEIDSQRSLFCNAQGVIAVEGENVEEIEERIEWKGTQNIFCGSLIALHDDSEDYEEDDQEFSIDPMDLQRWRQAILETGSRAERVFHLDADEFFDLSVNVNFRLSDIETLPAISAGARHK